MSLDTESTQRRIDDTRLQINTEILDARPGDVVHSAWSSIVRHYC